MVLLHARAILRYTRYVVLHKDFFELLLKIFQLLRFPGAIVMFKLIILISASRDLKQENSFR